MADVPVIPARVAPTNETEYERRTYRAGAALEAGDVCVWDANGKVVKTTTAPVAGDKIAGIALRKCAAGEPITLFQRGCLAGYTLTGADLEDLLYAGAAAAVADAGDVVIGFVIPFTATGEKMAYIDVTQTWVIVHPEAEP